MKRVDLKRSNKPLNRQSKKARAKNKPRAALKTKLLEERPICEWCKKAPSCDPHEKKMRSAGGNILDPENIWMLCRDCHSYAHLHPAQAHDEGWIKRRFG